jgi:hypothetical protein
LPDKQGRQSTIRDDEEENEMRAHIECIGTTALLMSTQQGADPTNELVRKLADITRIPGPKKTPENHEQIARIQFILNLPWVDGIGVHVPAVNFWNAIRDAARSDKMGKNVDRYVTPIQPVFKLIYDGPQSKEGLLEDKRFYDTRLVNHGGGGKTAMVIHTRPMFHPWRFEGEFRINETKIDPQDFTRWVEEVGEYHGIGAFRKFYGRFTATVTWGSDK